ncbi:MAG TPA: hypothetical protein PK771_06480 [Spirochaetota bacterium]|nr:hypothetical protein [Spirochaetota bacterium]
MQKNNIDYRKPPYKLSEIIILLISRSILFFISQLVVFLIILLFLGNNNWVESTKYWPLFALFGGVISLLLLHTTMIRKNESITIFYKFDKQYILKDIITIIILLIIIFPLIFISNILGAKLLFSDPAITQNMMFQKLPIWAIVLTFIFPVITGISEIPIYYGFVLPKLSKYIHFTIAVPIVVFFHLLQHCFLPFVFDFKFIIWRFIMFIPLAIMLAIVINWRKRLMPYLIIVHILLYPLI